MEIRSQGNPWLITDFVSAGTPMYFADQLMDGKDGRSFASRINRRELPTCPPHNEESEHNNIHQTRRFYPWEKKVWAGPKDAKGVCQAASDLRRRPFAVVRWTNVFFPVKFGIFGDWFGGPLAPTFGLGIKDVAVHGNTVGKPRTKPWCNRYIPAAAHSFCFKFAADDASNSVATSIRDGLDLACTSWIRSAPTSAADASGSPSIA
ncbi:hypothetical protein [Kribbella jiaozuonensis]|uniref:Uncharacterized protein n=1 Tax=Kribbella jiaozuonensis TaxID=2575441 RepID=A0A4U3M2E1_9ACTN|nr:hypothetical protein [Kribbella jiaozuonensis]TKK82811.1 hypothetical protein FDA38_08645 [Kribbella jiaozuonensis]